VKIEELLAASECPKHQIKYHAADCPFCLQESLKPRATRIEDGKPRTGPVWMFLRGIGWRIGEYRGSHLIKPWFVSNAFLPLVYGETTVDDSEVAGWIEIRVPGLEEMR
jgi:hypothetical protein